jgi:hypothetical protein
LSFFELRGWTILRSLYFRHFFVDFFWVEFGVFAYCLLNFVSNGFIVHEFIDLLSFSD